MLEHTVGAQRRSTPPSNLTEIIRDVTSRWRMKLALRGAVRSVGVAVAAVLRGRVRLGVGAVQPRRRSSPPGCCWRPRFSASVYYFLVRPLRRRVTDEQVALYLEEHEPSLQATLVSAVEASGQGGSESASAALVRRLVEQALEACASTNAVRRVEEAPLRRWGVVLAGVSGCRDPDRLLGPAFLRNALSAILLVQRSVEAAAPYRIEVTPGNANVPKGADQTMTATLAGFACRGCVADGASATADAQFESAAARARRRRPVRRDGVRRGRAARVLRRGRRRSIAGLYADRRRRAVRPAPGDGVPLPGLHRARAAEDRGRRRHRRAAGHRGPAARVPDDEDAWRARGAERQGIGRADAPGRRLADRRVHGGRATVSTASSSRLRARSARPRRRSTRSTC